MMIIKKIHNEINDCGFLNYRYKDIERRIKGTRISRNHGAANPRIFEYWNIGREIKKIISGSARRLAKRIYFRLRRTLTLNLNEKTVTAFFA
jgi:hypothetical protein